MKDLSFYTVHEKNNKEVDELCKDLKVIAEYSRDESVEHVEYIYKTLNRSLNIISSQCDEISLLLNEYEAEKKKYLELLQKD